MEELHGSLLLPRCIALMVALFYNSASQESDEYTRVGHKKYKGNADGVNVGEIVLAMDREEHHCLPLRT